MVTSSGSTALIIDEIQNYEITPSIKDQFYTLPLTDATKLPEFVKNSTFLNSSCHTESQNLTFDNDKELVDGLERYIDLDACTELGIDICPIPPPQLYFCPISQPQYCFINIRNKTFKL